MSSHTLLVDQAPTPTETKIQSIETVTAHDEPINILQCPPNTLSTVVQKQKLLLLLRHSSGCIAGDSCRVTRHCTEIKKLWLHIAICKSKLCQYQNCKVSKNTLIHFASCCDNVCPTCRPVRSLISALQNKNRCFRTPNALAKTKREKVQCVHLDR